MDEDRFEFGNGMLRFRGHPFDNFASLREIHAERELFPAAAPGMVHSRATEMGIPVEKSLREEVRVVTRHRGLQSEFSENRGLREKQRAIAGHPFLGIERGD